MLARSKSFRVLEVECSSMIASNWPASWEGLKTGHRKSAEFHYKVREGGTSKTNFNGSIAEGIRMKVVVTIGIA